MTPKEVLSGAIEVIKARGWGTDRLESSAYGRVCLYGAMNAAVSGDANRGGWSFEQPDLWGPIQLGFHRILHPKTANIEHFHQTISGWNDNVCGNAEEAIDLLDEVIKAL